MYYLWNITIALIPTKELLSVRVELRHSQPHRDVFFLEKAT